MAFIAALGLTALVVVGLYNAFTSRDARDKLIAEFVESPGEAIFVTLWCGSMLVAFWGTVSQLVFVALAAIGVPVLAGFQGGPSAIFGKTGGYVLGYILAALITALISKALDRKFWSLCVAMVVGCAVCYVLGTIWFMTLTGADLASALGWCVLPYLPGDIIKIALAAILTIQLDKRMPNL